MKFLVASFYITFGIYVCLGALHALVFVITNRIDCGWFCSDNISGIEHFILVILWPLNYM